MVFVLYLDDGFACGPLADVIRRALTFQHYQVEHRSDLGARGNPQCQQE